MSHEILDPCDACPWKVCYQIGGCVRDFEYNGLEGVEAYCEYEKHMKYKKADEQMEKMRLAG